MIILLMCSTALLFEKYILYDKDLVELELELCKIVGDGTTGSFWKDRWLDECARCSFYHLLF
jgi:hypothetical protein